MQLYLKSNRYNDYVRLTAVRSHSFRSPGRSRSQRGDLISSPGRSRSRSLARFRELAYNNSFSWFGTITISPATFISKFGTLPTMENVELVRAWLTSIFNRIKKSHEDFAFLCVPELQENGNVHLHGLFRLSREHKVGKGNKFMIDAWILKNVGLNRFIPIGNRANAVSYVTKYMLKSDADIFKTSYFCSRGLLRAESFSAEFDDDLYFYLALAVSTSSLKFKLSHSDCSFTIKGHLSVLVELVENSCLDVLLPFVIFHCK